MTLTATETLLMILAVAAGCLVTRFLPFLLFPDSRTLPAGVVYLGRVLPPAMMGMLVVYSLKGIDLTADPFGLPELLAVALIVILHRWKHNTLLSIACGTAFYMALVQLVF